MIFMKERVKIAPLNWLEAFTAQNELTLCSQECEPLCPDKGNFLSVKLELFSYPSLRWFF